jgi:hypothetical protein
MTEHLEPADEVRLEGNPTVADEERFTSFVISGGATMELTCALAAVVLAIIGLCGPGPRYMAGVGAIAIGLGLVVGGGAPAARWEREARRARRVQKAELAGGLGTEVLAGLAGIVCAAIGLANYAPQILLPIAILVLGLGHVLGSAVQPLVASFVVDRDPEFDHKTRVMAESTIGPMAFVGIGSMVLGVLGLIGIVPLSLVLVATLAMGCALLFAGAAEALRFAHRLHELA